MMIGITEIAGYLPPDRTSNLELMTKFDINEEFIDKKIGIKQCAKMKLGQDTSDLCCEAFSALQVKFPLDPQEIDCLIVCTQNPDVRGLPHTSAIVHDKLGLSSDCAAFDVSLGCSGYVYCLSIAKTFMEGNGFKRGLLFTADPYSKILNRDDKNTSLLFGDGATVTLLSDKPTWLIGETVFGTKGSEGQAIRVSRESNKLEMNGRSVFSFSATVIPNHIKQVLKKNNLGIEDIDLFVLHQGSRYIVDTICQRLGVESKKVPFAANQYGNTVSSSIPFVLADLDVIVDKICITGFGVGLSWAGTVLFKVS